MMHFRPGLAMKALGALVCVFLLMPLVAVIPVSFTSKRYLSMPNGQWSLRHYQTLIENDVWRDSFLLSIKIGIASSLLACILAATFCIGIWLLQPRFSKSMTGLVIMPMVVPPVISALIFYFLLSHLTKFNEFIAYDKWGGVTLAHVVMTVPYAVVIIMVALSQLDRRMDLAAQSMGAGPFRRIFGVILPNIRFGLVSAFFLCFLLSWDEIGVTLFVTSVDTITLPRRMWMGLRDNIDPTIAAIAVLLICFTTVVTVGRLLVKLRQKRIET